MGVRPRPITTPVPTADLRRDDRNPAGHRPGWAAPPAPTQQQGAPTSLADITEHLHARLGGRLGIARIARVVRQCHRELEIAHGPVTPQALEYLAQERLAYLLDTGR